MKSLYILLFSCISNFLFAQTDPAVVRDTVKQGNSTIIFTSETPIETKQKTSTTSDTIRKGSSTIIFANDAPVVKEQQKANVTEGDSIKKGNTTIIFKSDVPEKPKVTAKNESTTAQLAKLDKPRIRYREVGLNMTSLLSQLMPLSNALPLAGPTTIYLKKYKGNKAFRFGLGLQASADANLGNAIIRIGSEKKKTINEKWAFTRATDFIWAFGSFNTPGFSVENNRSSIGAGFGYGLEYNINKFISVSTESTVFLGLGGGENSVINFKIIPPIALFLNVKLY